jgi:hypothetical protein
MGAAEVDAEARDRTGLVDDPIRQIDDCLPFSGRLGAHVVEGDQIDEEGVVTVAAGNTASFLGLAPERADLDDRHLFDLIGY